LGKPTRSGNFTVSNKDTDGIYLVIYQIDINYTSAQAWSRSFIHQEAFGVARKQINNTPVYREPI